MTEHAATGRLTHVAWQVATKVPKLTIYFWIIKILTTALGESFSDYMVNSINPYVAVGIGGTFLLVALSIQFSVKTYIPWVYWLTALAVSVAGTMGADVTHVAIGIPYIVSVGIYSIVLGLLFIAWYKREKTLSIHSISTKPREAFYWAVVLATFALGTAAGDVTAYTFHLGFITSAIIFIGIFSIPCILYWVFKVNAIFTFWFAYILTRPIGASFADWFGKPVAGGGIGVGSLVISGILFLLLIIFVAYVSLRQVDSFHKITETN
jgi:uncharacterized membrane-anchored protein